MHIEIVPATLEHAHRLAPNLRQQDKDEVWASGGFSPLKALTSSVEASEPDLVWTALADGEPFIIWGVAPSGDPKLGIVWLLGSETIYKLPRRFVRDSFKYVSKMHERFDTLTNYVDARNITSQLWLAHLGFESSSPVNVGPEGRPFIQFTKERPHV